MYAVSSEIAPPVSTPSTTPTGRVRRIHPAWPAAAVAFLALVGAAAFRAAPSVLIDPLHDDFGWSRASISAAVSVNLVLYGLTAPFAAALMERFGIRKVVTAALALIALGSGLTVFMTTTWQLVLLWGVLVGLGTGSMALAFVATVTDRWFVARRGLVTGILTAGGAAGQLVFLPVLATLAERYDWQTVVGDGVVRRARRGATGTAVPAQPSRGRRHHAVRRPRRLRAARDSGRTRRRGRPGARRPPLGRPHPRVLAAGRHVRDLRRQHQRTGRHSLRPGRARPRHARDGGREPARGDRHLRPGRHHRVGLVHRPLRRRASCSASTTRCAASHCSCCRCCSHRPCTRR